MKYSEAQRPIQMRRAHQIIEPVAHQHALDLDQPQQTTPRDRIKRLRVPGCQSARVAVQRLPAARGVAGAPRADRAARAARSTPRRKCSASGRGTRSPLSCARYSARLRTELQAARRAFPGAAARPRSSTCARAAAERAREQRAPDPVAAAPAARGTAARAAASPSMRTSPRANRGLRIGAEQRQQRQRRADDARRRRRGASPAAACSARRSRERRAGGLEHRCARACR